MALQRGGGGLQLSRSGSRADEPDVDQLRKEATAALSALGEAEPPPPLATASAVAAAAALWRAGCSPSRISYTGLKQCALSRPHRI